MLRAPRLMNWPPEFLQAKRGSPQLQTSHRAPGDRTGVRMGAAVEGCLAGKGCSSCLRQRWHSRQEVSCDHTKTWPQGQLFLGFSTHLITYLLTFLLKKRGNIEMFVRHFKFFYLNVVIIYLNADINKI